MENAGVNCNVYECTHNVSGTKCDLTKIDVVNDKTGANAIATPHFCKSFENK